MATKKIVKKPAVKKVAAKPAVVATPVAPAACACACGAGCKCHGGFGRFIKRLIIFLVIFALGFVACKLCCHHKMMRKFPRPEFVNGCMDVANIKCPEMLARVQKMDADANNCITKEEFRAAKKEMWKDKANKINDKIHNEIAEEIAE